MAEKDISQKILEAKPDVFADIVNGLCFNGREVIKADELQDFTSLTAYDDKKKYRYIQRDITRLWKKGIFNIACLGIENQISKDNTMPLRVIAYDGNMALENGKYYVQNEIVYRCTRDTVNPVYNALADLVGIYVEVVK